MKYYAVKKGRQTGIFNSWSTCQQQVNGFKQAQFKSFKTKRAAQVWLDDEALSHPPLNKTNSILLFTDGGSRNHGNHLGDHVHQNDKAAWAFLIHRNGHNVCGTGGEYGVTNNRMELMALKMALKVLGQRGWNNENILATLDSRYVLDGIQKNWLANWQRNNWVTSSGEPVKNKKLWQEIAALLPHFPHLYFQWTKGHANNKGNVIVDCLLNKTMDKMKK